MRSRDNITSRRSYLKGVTGLATAGIAGCTGNGGGGSNSDFPTVQMSATSGASFGQFIADVFKGEEFDHQNDVNIEITEAGPSEVPQLVINGSVDTGFGNPTGMALARTEGHEVSIYGPWNANHSSLLAPADSDVSGWDDLVGEEIGILGPPSGIWNHTSMLMAERGRNLEEDFETRTGAPPAIQSWITGGDVAAGVLFYPLIVPPLVEGDLVEVGFIPDMLEETFGRVYDFVNLIALDPWLEESPELAERTQQTLIDAHEYVQNNPVGVLEEYGAEVTVESDEEIELMAEKLPGIVPGWDTQEAQENIQEQLEFVKELGMIPEDAPTDIVADI